jgi:Heterokaryon incompatibility protein (HET)
MLTDATMVDLHTPVQVQIGLPVLSEAGSNAHFEVIRCWLKDCDEEHGDFKCTSQSTGGLPMLTTGVEDDDFESAILREIQSRKLFKLPTRLIDVEVKGSPTVHLYKTQPGDKSEDFKYIALSHPWGDPKTQKDFFRTTMDNKEAHMKQIDISQLPDTFKDAIITTRALGIQYIWIDSICIIQGAGGDFNSESKRMEDVFSSAYCIIAASCATGQWDGFLKSRTNPPQRDYVTFQRGSDPPFYVCRFIDDFNHDVLEGSLNQRGWVLQERALARRTAYFTGQQTYWECGGGVRCETLTKMYK